MSHGASPWSASFALMHASLTTSTNARRIQSATCCLLERRPARTPLPPTHTSQFAMFPRQNHALTSSDATQVACCRLQTSTAAEFIGPKQYEGTEERPGFCLWRRLASLPVALPWRAQYLEERFGARRPRAGHTHELAMGCSQPRRRSLALTGHGTSVSQIAKTVGILGGSAIPRS